MADGTHYREEGRGSQEELSVSRRNAPGPKGLRAVGHSCGRPAPRRAQGSSETGQKSCNSDQFAQPSPSTRWAQMAGCSVARDEISRRRR